MPLFVAALVVDVVVGVGVREITATSKRMLRIARLPTRESAFFFWNVF
jgi:hypothetical protein